MGILPHPAAAAARGRLGRVCRSNRFRSDFVPRGIAFFSRHSRFSAGGIATGFCVSFLESHSTQNYFSDSAFWQVPLDFKKMEDERGHEII